MTIPRYILALIILLFAAYILVMNWACVIVSLRNKRRGIDRHHSTVPVVTLILAALADTIFPRADSRWMLTIPLLDIANWSLLWLPFGLIREWRKKGTGASPNAAPPHR